MILFQMDYRTKHRAHMQEAIVKFKIFILNLNRNFSVFEKLVLSLPTKLKELNEIL